jgi:hypothetical protein
MKTIAYIIGFRSHDLKDRSYENLISVLQWLVEIKKMLYLGEDIKLKIIVIEQDSTSRLIIPKNIAIYIQHLFIYNNGSYNKGWAFNVGYFHFSADYYFFASHNIIMKKENIINVFKTCFKYEAVKPYLSIYNSSEDYSLDENFDPLIWVDPINFTQRQDLCFANGIVGVSYIAIKSISGWDERFRERGCEDFAFTAKINLFLYSTKIYSYSALYLWCQDELNTPKLNNDDLNEEYFKYAFNDYVNIIENACIGYSIKYSTSRPLEYESNYKLSKSRYNFGQRRYNRLRHKYGSNKKIYLMLCEQQYQLEQDDIAVDSVYNTSSPENSYITKSETFEM